MCTFEELSKPEGVNLGFFKVYLEDLHKLQLSQHVAAQQKMLKFCFMVSYSPSAQILKCQPHVHIAH